MKNITSLRSRKARGFTLIEMLIATAVAGVLSSIAYPSFTGTVQKVRRTDALVAMLQVQAAQERWRSSNVSYGSLAEIRQGAVSPAKHYDIDLRATTETGYEVMATARGAQSRDIHCRTMKLVMSGMNPSYSSGPDAAHANPADINRQCWNL